MEQVDPEIVKEHFDMVLSVVQETAKKRTERFLGRTVKVLCEEVNESDDTFIDGRMSSNTVVHLKGSKDLIGKIVEVKLTEFHGFYYTGELV